MINYSKTIVFYEIFFGILVPYAVDPANQARLGITDVQKAELLDLKSDWDTAYKKYIDPTTYGKLSIAVINKSYKTSHIFTDGLTQQLKNNKSIILSNLDLIVFNIHVDNPKSKIKAPSVIPTLVLRSTTHLNSEIQAINAEDPTSAAKPPRVKRLKIIMLVLDANAVPPTIDMLKPEMESGYMRFDIPHTEDQVGKIAYVAACFSNDTGDSEYSAILACPII